MATHAPTTTNVIAVLIATIAALFARSWLQVELLQEGYEPHYAADLSALVMPPILLLLLFPVWRKDRPFLKRQFRRADLNWRVVLMALATGILLRLLWWSQLVAGVAFGHYRNDDPFAVAGPVFSFSCPAPQVLMLGFFVMALMVPLIEEVAHRAYVQTALSRFGPVIAVAGSATVFTVLHKPGGWVFIFLCAVVFGTQYLVSGSLWSSMISHATVNGLAQLDWRCLNANWNPHASTLPLWGPGGFGVAILLASIIGIVLLLLDLKNRGG